MSTILRRREFLLLSIGILSISNVLSAGEISFTAIIGVVLGTIVLIGYACASLTGDAPTQISFRTSRLVFLFTGLSGLALDFAVMQERYSQFRLHDALEGVMLALGVSLLVISYRSIGKKWRRPFWYLIGASTLWSVIFLLGAQSWGHGFIEDVYTVVTQSSLHLLHFHSPYSYYYYNGKLVLFYGPGVPILAAFGAIFGEIRISSVLAVGIMCVSIAKITSATEKTASPTDNPTIIQWQYVLLSLIFSPFIICMIEAAWVDVFVMGGIALWMWMQENTGRGRTIIGIVALTACLSVKPYAVLFLWPIFIWEPKMRKSIYWSVAATGLVYFIFIAWTGFDRYYHMTFLSILALPVQAFSLSIATFYLNHTHHVLPVLLLPVLLVISGILCYLVPMGSYRITLVAGSILSLVGFLFARQTYFNYYFDSVMLLWLAYAYGQRPLPSSALSTAERRWFGKIFGSAIGRVSGKKAVPVPPKGSV